MRIQKPLPRPGSSSLAAAATTAVVHTAAVIPQAQAPVWIPGSYLVREFAQHLLHISATQAGQPVSLRQLDKNTWQAANHPDAPLVLRAEFYAFDPSVRTAWLDPSRGFFNPTSRSPTIIAMIASRISLSALSSSPVLEA